MNTETRQLLAGLLIVCALGACGQRESEKPSTPVAAPVTSSRGNPASYSARINGVIVTGKPDDCSISINSVTGVRELAFTVAGGGQNWLFLRYAFSGKSGEQRLEKLRGEWDGKNYARVDSGRMQLSRIANTGKRYLISGSFNGQVTGSSPAAGDAKSYTLQITEGRLVEVDCLELSR